MWRTSVDSLAPSSISDTIATFWKAAMVHEEPEMLFLDTFPRAFKSIFLISILGIVFMPVFLLFMKYFFMGLIKKHRLRQQSEIDTPTYKAEAYRNLEQVYERYQRFSEEVIKCQIQITENSICALEYLIRKLQSLIKGHEAEIAALQSYPCASVSNMPEVLSADKEEAHCSIKKINAAVKSFLTSKILERPLSALKPNGSKTISPSALKRKYPTSAKLQQSFSNKKSDCTKQTAPANGSKTELEVEAGLVGSDFDMLSEANELLEIVQKEDCIPEVEDKPLELPKPIFEFDRQGSSLFRI